jgi:thiamine pyrophosphokinase
MPGRTALVFGGAPVTLSPRLRARLAGVHDPLVVAADSGAALALRLGLVPSVVVGDLDSINQETLTELQQRGISIETYPTDKDVTDGQLAIQRALALHPAELVLVGYLGGPRLDQELANVLLLSQLTVPAVLLDASNECRLLRPGETWAWPPDRGEIVSLMPLSGDAQGVSTRGLRWALDQDTLVFGDTRGLSNEPIDADASVSLTSGLLLVTRHFPEGYT